MLAYFRIIISWLITPYHFVEQFMTTVVKSWHIFICIYLNVYLFMTYNVLIMAITNIFLYTVPKYFIKNKKLIIKYYY